MNWYVRDSPQILDGQEVAYAVDACHTECIANVHGFDDNGRINAHLIASAPELYAALQEIIAITDRNHVAWDRAKAAIAKAEGKQP